MKVHGTDQSLLGRLVLIALMGGPFWAANLAMDGEFLGSLLVIVVWLTVAVTLVIWLSREKLVRLPFSLSVVTIMAIIYSLVLYGSWST